MHGDGGILSMLFLHVDYWNSSNNPPATPHPQTPHDVHTQLLTPLILEHLQRCSVCEPSKSNWMKKNQNMPVWLRQIVLEKSVVNKYDPTTIATLQNFLNEKHLRVGKCTRE